MALCRVRTVWTGWPGAPGVSTMLFDAAATPPLTAVSGFWTAVRSLLPSAITLQVEGTGQTLDPLTGKANGNWTGTAPAPVQGFGGPKYAGPSGAMVSWRTGAFIDGREVRGKTFLVPGSIDDYDSDGTIDPTKLGLLQTAATALASSSNALTILSRATGGTAKVTSAVAVDKVVVLRSRRS